MEFGDRDLSLAITLLAKGIDADDTQAAVAWLADRRGTDGVPLDEAFNDLTTAYRVAAGLNPAPEEYRDFALAWVEASLGALHTRGALDANTGLATRDYLATRLRDLARLGASTGHRLLIIGPGADRHRLVVMLRAGRIAHELVETFSAVETPMQLAGDRIGAIVADDDTLPAGLAGLRLALARIDGAASPTSHGASATSLDLNELPSSAAAVGAFLDAL